MDDAYVEDSSIESSMSSRQSDLSRYTRDYHVSTPKSSFSLPKWKQKYTNKSSDGLQNDASSSYSSQVDKSSVFSHPLETSRNVSCMTNPLHDNFTNKQERKTSTDKISNCSSKPTTDKTNENVSSSNDNLVNLEESVLHRNIYRTSFRSKNATKNFSLNPLYENGSDNLVHKNLKVREPVPIKIPDQSSDYYSSIESLPYLSSFSREGSIKLPKPKVTEDVYEPLGRRGTSMRLPKRETKEVSRKSSLQVSKNKSMMY